MSSFELRKETKPSASKSIEKCVILAIARGFQISPGAVKMFQAFAEKNQTALSPEAVIDLVLEEKARRSISDRYNNENAVTENDLVSILPDIFESILSAEKQRREKAQTPAVQVQEEAYQRPPEEIESNIEIVNDPSSRIKPVGVNGFSELFKNRYEKLIKILRERPEARSLVSTQRVNMEKGVSRVAGLVYSKRPTKSGSIELIIDDASGKLSALAVSESAKKAVNETVPDQCVMIEVEGKGERLVLKNLIQPDIPKRVFSTSKKTAYAVFLSDLHIGSNKFLDGAFTRFLDWLNGANQIDALDEEIIRRLKYVIIGGDVVDGVGVFPNQEYELSENNVFKQYQMVANRLASIPPHLQMLIVPGNHDSTRQALPQPMIPRKYAGPLYELKNVTMLGDPSLIRLNGVSILIYHGRSLDDVMAMGPGLSYEKPTDAMKVLLKARHLAPTFGSRTPIAPEEEDYLVIEDVPDIFHTGHVHSVGVDSYKGTLMINSGTWQAQTGYQKNLGIMPRPGLVPIVNLATLEVHLREFLVSREKASIPGL